MNILVTGGAGFIGSHTCVILMEAGYSVIIVDDLSNSKRESIRNVSKITNKDIIFYEIDITNAEALDKVFNKHKIGGVIHFAGYKAVNESIQYPLKYYNNNVCGTVTLIEKCLEYKVNKFIFSSSATVYGDNKSPVTEEMKLSPAVNPYGETKVIAERILTDVVESNPSLSVSILRYFNPIGAHESGLIGENPKEIPNNILPYITQVANGKLKNLKIFGDDYPTRDGTGIRDYIHVMDVAEGHLSAFENLTTGINTYNLGTGKGTSVLELVNCFEEVNKVEIPYEVVEKRLGDLAIVYADVSKAKRELGWEAKRNIATMCKDSWRYEIYD